MERIKIQVQREDLHLAQKLETAIKLNRQIKEEHAKRMYEKLLDLRFTLN